ncbi:MAG: hypothetical protein K6F35_07295 [Lachnospiraceae bacterium]|nr:hypothetical protein [Lachnospiraceae bacterium]
MGDLRDASSGRSEIKRKGSFEIKMSGPFEENEAVINEKVHCRSRLMRTIAAGHIAETIQQVFAEEKDKETIKPRTFENFRANQKSTLANLILKHVKTSARFLSLKDLGNRETTVPDIELAEVERLVVELDRNDISFDDMLSAYRKGLLKKHFGIEVKDSSELLGGQKGRAAGEAAGEAVREGVRETVREAVREAVREGVRETVREAVRETVRGREERIQARGQHHP